MAELVTTLTLIFAASSAVLLLTHRFSHPSIPAYIAAGVLVGGFVEGSELLQLSRLGIAFIVFLFGLKIEASRIAEVAEESLSSALVQVAVVGTASFILGRGLGLNVINSVYLSAAAALSSSIVGLQLIEDVEVEMLHGRLSESINLVQDLLAVAALIVISSPSLQAGAVATDLGYGALLVVLAAITRKTVFPGLAEAAQSSSELVLLTGLSVMLSFVALGEFLGLSIVVGSFAAGLAAARFPHNLQLLETFNPLKDFFSAIFFVSLGALLSVPTASSLAFSAIIIVSTVAVKPVITAVTLMMNGYDRRTSYLTGLTLDQVSEFALIMAIEAFIAGTIATQLFDGIILAAATTMVISAYTGRQDEKIYRLLSSYSRIEVSAQQIERRTNVTEVKDHVILVGYDVQGKRLAESLKESGTDFVVMENDPEKINEAADNHDLYVFGDAMDDKTWRTANVEEASLIVSTVPQEKISRHILEMDADADVILRSDGVEEASRLLDSGALYVEVPDIVASRELLEHINGVMEQENYREELRRQNILEIRRYMEQQEG